MLHFIVCMSFYYHTFENVSVFLKFCFTSTSCRQYENRVLQQSNVLIFYLCCRHGLITKFVGCIILILIVQTVSRSDNLKWYFRISKQID